MVAQWFMYQLSVSRVLGSIPGKGIFFACQFLSIVAQIFAFLECWEGIGDHISLSALSVCSHRSVGTHMCRQKHAAACRSKKFFRGTALAWLQPPTPASPTPQPPPKRAKMFRRSGSHLAPSAPIFFWQMVEGIFSFLLHVCILKMLRIFWGFQICSCRMSPKWSPNWHGLLFERPMLACKQLSSPGSQSVGPHLWGAPMCSP